jgi:predicted nucleotidyltransferase component of viral defense system
MALLEKYRQQVALLMRVLPLVAEEKAFALKGGTAINLFVRDMPRLSVDIDLAYLPVENRTASLKAIDAAMLRIAAAIERRIPGAKTTPSRLEKEKTVTKIVVRAADTQIKIEVTPVLRGCVYEPTMMTVTAPVEAAFGFAEIQTVSFADLYAGKIVAALDRQHPRDLFDVRDLLANEGISDELRLAFIVYVLSHPRPMAEILNPKRKAIDAEFQRGFEGMTTEPVPLEELLAAREALIDVMVGQMPDAHRQFLLSFKQGPAAWTLLNLPGVHALPAVQWKQQNLDTLSPDKRSALAAALEAVLQPKA